MTTLPEFRLQFPAARIRELAQAYTEDQTPEGQAEEQQLLDAVGPAVRKRGHYQRGEFVDLCHWKSQRPKKRYEAISDALVIEATRAALSAKDENLRVGILTLLDGVGWPTASVLLHFGHPDPYPVLDVRALEALGVSQPSGYTFKFWWAYVSECRRLAEEHGVDMRTLDRALWQWSSERN